MTGYKCKYTLPLFSDQDEWYGERSDHAVPDQTRQHRIAPASTQHAPPPTRRRGEIRSKVSRHTAISHGRCARVRRMLRWHAPYLCIDASSACGLGHCCLPACAYDDHVRSAFGPQFCLILRFSLPSVILRDASLCVRGLMFLATGIVEPRRYRVENSASRTRLSDRRHSTAQRAAAMRHSSFFPRSPLTPSSRAPAA